MEDLVTIAEAAELLGQHKNTVRNKVKAGKLVSIKVQTEHGETYMIPKGALHGESVTVTLPTPPVDQVIDERTSIATVDQTEKAREAIRELIAPFVTELSQKTEELGTLKERVRTLEVENDRLRSAATMPVLAPRMPVGTRLKRLLGIEATGV